MSYRYDIDKAAGEVVENLVDLLISKNGRVQPEVKRDQKTAHTGNIAIEYGRDGVMNTGIMHPECPEVIWYALDNVNGSPMAFDLLFRKSILIPFLQSRLGRNNLKPGGDGGRTMLVLLNLNDVKEYIEFALRFKKEEPNV